MLFRGKRQHDDQGSEIQESWANQNHLRNPALWGPATHSGIDDTALGESSVGTNAGQWRWPSSSSGCRPHYVCEGLKESSTTWHGYATACQESIQPKAMWAPALVPPPLIGRHRSRMQLGCSRSHPFKQVSRPTHATHL